MMSGLKTKLITFAIGTGLIATGLTPIPSGEAFIVTGSSLSSLAYGLVFVDWMRRSAAREPVPTTAVPSSGITPSAPISPDLKQSASGAGIPSGTANAATPVSPTASSTTFTETGIPAPHSADASSLPTTGAHVPPATVARKPKSLQQKLPTIKGPRVGLPEPIAEHLVPLSLIVAGLPLIVGGLIFAGFSPSVALGYGLLVPGVLVFGLGGIMLFLQLYRRPVGLRRFCMHCGFQMSTVEVACGRCHKQPMSGMDTRVCPNCSTVIPTLAKFCKDCGAGQPGQA